MGVYCKINLCKPSDGAYTPNSNVSGVIKYGVDEATVFEKITVSLKGIGVLRVEEDNGDDRMSSTYVHKEVYIDADNIINNEKKIPHEIGMYETQFNFMLPDNIPSTLHYKGRNVTYDIKCDITYNIIIKFERPGFMQFTKIFKKELTVVSKVKPSLHREPIIYGEQKILFQLLSTKKNIVHLKANMKKSVIPTGGNIEFEYEVNNDTNIKIKGIAVKLFENHTFILSSGKAINMYKDIENTDSKTGSIKSGEKKHFDGVINVPSDVSTLGHSKIVSRKYVVRITVELPFPHLNFWLHMPVEIGDLVEDVELGQEALEDEAVGCSNSNTVDLDNPPPSYWEAMGEMTTDDESKSGTSSASSK